MKRDFIHKFFIFLTAISLLPLLSHAQRNKRYKWEAGIDIGASNFLGDLGGANQIGTNGVKDLELSLTNFALGAHVRYKKARYIGYKAQFNWGKVSGDDKLTTEPYRNNRNINFVSNIFEFNTQLEFYITNERGGHRYNYKKLKGWRHIDMQTYGFFGVGGFWYNPKAYYPPLKEWLALRDLRTEGQGIKPGRKMYSRVSVCIPIGIGFKYGINRQWSVGLEYGIRKTFTDYIDDTSTTYWDPGEIAAAQTDPFLQNAAAYFSNPTTGAITAANNGGISPTGIGQQRGDSTDNDAYMFAQVTVNYKIGKIRKTKSKF